MMWIQRSMAENLGGILEPAKITAAIEAVSNFPVCL
jgi:hypothetical protein